MGGQRAPNRVDRVFGDLKKQGYVPDYRKLVIRRRYSSDRNFKVIGLLAKKICCFGNCSQLSDDAIRFCLLHEEGHIAQRQNSTLFKVLLAALFAPIFIYMFYMRMVGSALPSVFFLVLFLYLFNSLLLPRIFRRQLERDEILSDVYASRALRIGYGVSDPSSILKEALDELSSKRRRSFLSDFISFILLDIHPSNEERVEIVKKMSEAQARIV